MPDFAWGALSSPVGELTVACSAAGLADVSFGPRRRRPPASPPPAPAAAQDHLSGALGELAEYFAGQRRTFSLPVDWSLMSAAQQRVLPVLMASAGYGQTITYGALAREAGVTDGGTMPPARVVGQIMGSNPCPVVVPCHRVVAGNGLGGYSGGTGIEIKHWLLIFEGAVPATLDWDPAGPHAATR